MAPHIPDFGDRTAILHLRGRWHGRGITKTSIFIVALIGLAGCAAPSPEHSSALRGVGTPGVSSYPGGNQATTLQALLDRCRQVPTQPEPLSGTQNLGAACNQLRRTMHSQPGNTVQPGATP